MLASASAAPLTDQTCGADLLYSSGTAGRSRGIGPRLPDRGAAAPERKHPGDERFGDGPAVYSGALVEGSPAFRSPCCWAGMFAVSETVAPKSSLAGVGLPRW